MTLHFIKIALSGPILLGLFALPKAIAGDLTRQPSYSYQQIKTALLAGKEVSVIIQLEQCSHHNDSKQAGPKIQGGLRINRFLIPNNQYIAFSDTHNTLDYDNNPVIETIRYRIMPDERVLIRTSKTLLTDSKGGQTSAYLCTIGQGITFIW